MKKIVKCVVSILLFVVIFAIEIYPVYAESSVKSPGSDDVQVDKRITSGIYQYGIANEKEKMAVLYHINSEEKDIWSYVKN